VNWTDPMATQNAVTGHDTPVSTLDLAPLIAGVLPRAHVPSESCSINTRWMATWWPDG
jgi:hypothetical protein